MQKQRKTTKTRPTQINPLFLFSFDCLFVWLQLWIDNKKSKNQKIKKSKKKIQGGWLKKKKKKKKKTSKGGVLPPTRSSGGTARGSRASPPRPRWTKYSSGSDRSARRGTWRSQAHCARQSSTWGQTNKKKKKMAAMQSKISEKKRTISKKQRSDKLSDGRVMIYKK
jgi:hypothetical protein